MRRKFYAVVIDEIRDETPDVFSLFFRNPDPGLFTYLPGQYLTIRLRKNGEDLRRCFSLSSSPFCDDRLCVTIKRIPGGVVSNVLRDEFKVGDSLEIMPPMGNFAVEINPVFPRHYILIGGGSGITPLMSILKSVLTAEPGSEVSLWYANRTETDIIFRDEIQLLQRKYKDRLFLHLTLSQPDPKWKGFSGRLDKNCIYDRVSEVFMTSELRKVYYICGPEGMISGAMAALEKHAVNPADIHRELYTTSAPDEQAETPAEVPVETVLSDGEETYTLQTQKIRVILDGEKHEISVSPDQVILRAAIKADLDPPFACQSGICTTCRAMLYAGIVSMDETEGLSEEELNEGYILTCQSHPLTADVEIEYR
ncbi:MAG: ferredoxin--NADP reductase [Bacteroidia bacterium]|nr:ferredoxin--NADP reductase [Bacteroidia bacterium]